MGARGPAKGSGGRPRTKTPAANDAGYKLTTNGPKSNGTRELLHRTVAYGGTVGGTKKPPKSSDTAKTGIVNHKDMNRADDRRSNLEITSRSTNNLSKYRTPSTKTKASSRAGTKSVGKARR